MTPADLARVEPLRAVDYGLPRQCYANAASYCQQHGGTVVHGWLVEDYGSFVILLHHAVVRSAVGLLDVTPQPRRFLPDDTARFELAPDGSVRAPAPQMIRREAR